MDEEPLGLADWIERCGGELALVFTDIVASTHLLYSRGTQNYTGTLQAHRRRAAELARSKRGRLIDSARDELLAAFPSVERAWAFASELLRDPGDPQLRVRMGIHYGPVRTDDGALAGRTVHFGARVLDHVSDHEVWMSEPARAALEAEAPEVAAGLRWRAAEQCELKGIPERQTLWRVD